MTNLNSLAEAFHKAGLRIDPGKHKRAGYTKPTLEQRRAKRRKKNKVAKQSRKRNR